MFKILIFIVMYFIIVFSVVYVLIGSIVVGGLVVVVELLCNLVGFYFYEKIWKCFEKDGVLCLVSVYGWLYCYV